MLARAVFPVSVNLALALIAVAASLAGCGGGGGRGDSFAPDSSANKSASDSHAAVRPAQGDWVMYAHSLTVNGASGSTTTEGYVTRTFQSVTPDGPVMLAETSADAGAAYKPVTTSIVDAHGALARYTTEGSETCTFTPAFTGAATVTPGFERIVGSYTASTTWDINTQSSCQNVNGAPFAGSINTSGAVVGAEQITVRGRRFSTLKEIYSTTITPLAASSTAPVRRIDYTCWRDTSLGRVVKCTVTQASRPSGATEFREDSRSGFELAGYSLYEHPVRLPPVSQFAGVWMIHYSGSQSGSCPAIRIGTDGTITGDCAVTTASGIQGSVKSTGEFSFTTAGGASFTGLLRNPVEGNGNWSTPAGGGGAWSISHR